jgi:hypothetical protein
MQNLTFKTGRKYSSDQILDISIEKNGEDEFGLRDIVATFVDSSRGISGRVEIVVFDSSDIGKAVLSAYDSGRYTTI